MSFVDISRISNLNLLEPTQIIDSQERCRFSSDAYCSRLFSFPTQSRLNREFLQKVKDFFRQKMGLHDRAAFENLWAQTFATRKISWNPSQPLTGATLQMMEVAFRDTLIYHGKGIEAEAVQNGQEPYIRQAVQYLLGRRNPSFQDWFSDLRLVKAILVRQNPQVLQCFREEMRQTLRACENHFPTPDQEVLFQAFVGNIIGLIPYCYPQEGEQFPIPQKIGGVWKMIPYKVDRKLSLTPQWFSSPMVAYGLVSEEAEGDPILSFLGTTYPAGEGYVATVLSDFTPFTSVGKLPYFFGKRAIAGWLENKKDVQVYGISLGGAMSFHVLRNHTHQLSRVEAYNPPGFYPWDWKSQEYSGNAPKVNIYYQENDIVATMGHFPRGSQVSVYRVLPEIPEGMRGAHIRAYTGARQVTLLKSDSEYENRRTVRKIMTLIHITLGMIFFFFPYLIIYLLTRPFVLAYHLCQRQAKQNVINFNV